MTVVPNIIAAESQPLLPAEATFDEAAEIELTIPQQDVDNWCWAAVTAGLEAFFGIEPARRQCEIVTEVLGTGPCCPEGADIARCNVPHAPQAALGELFAGRVNAPAGISLAFLRQEIVDRELPVLANLGFDDARVGHLVVISGFRRTGNNTTVFVWDPYTGHRSEEPLRHFRQGRDRGKWRASYRLKRPVPLDPQ